MKKKITKKMIAIATNCDRVCLRQTNMCDVKCFKSLNFFEAEVRRN